MNIAVAAITLNIFSPFILFYFFALAAVAPAAWRCWPWSWQQCRWLKWRCVRSAGVRSAGGCQPGTVAPVDASTRTALPAGLEFDSLNLKGIQLGCSKVGLLAKSYVAYSLNIHLFKL